MTSIFVYFLSHSGSLVVVVRDYNRLWSIVGTHTSAAYFLLRACPLMTQIMLYKVTCLHSKLHSKFCCQGVSCGLGSGTNGKAPQCPKKNYLAYWLWQIQVAMSPSLKIKHIQIICCGAQAKPLLILKTISEQLSFGTTMVSKREYM